MGSLRVRYLVAKQRSRRPTRYYWQPTKKLQEAGFAVRRLSDDPLEAAQQAETFNAKLDRWYRGETDAKTGPAPGTLTALSESFQRDDAFLNRMRPRTQKDYLYSIKLALIWAGDTQASDLTRKSIKTWYNAIRDERGPATARNSIAALRRLLSFAMDEGWITQNPALALRLSSPGSRDRVWTEEEVDRFCTAAMDAGVPSMALAVMLGWYLGQRPADLRTLAWSAYDGMRVTIKQAKTNQRVGVRVLPELKAMLDSTPRTAVQMVVSETTGRPYQESHFQHTFAEIREKAGLSDDLQFRDLRRTVATDLGSGGSTDDQIRSVTGHKTREVVAVYVRPDDTFADGAMDKLEKVRGTRVGRVQRIRPTPPVDKTG